MKTPIYSTMADDPEMRDLLIEFLEDLPRRLVVLFQAEAEGRLEDLLGGLHQLKGVAGAFGYDSLSEVAAELEVEFLEDEPDPVRRDTGLEQMREICRAALRGAALDPQSI